MGPDIPRIAFVAHVSAKICSSSVSNAQASIPNKSPLARHGQE